MEVERDVTRDNLENNEILALSVDANDEMSTLPATLKSAVAVIEIPGSRAWVVWGEVRR